MYNSSNVFFSPTWQTFINFKSDIIKPELTNFDIISLTETWLNDSISNEDLKFNEFQDPFRRYRVGDSHGGVLVYVIVVFSVNADLI